MITANDIISQHPGPTIKIAWPILGALGPHPVKTKGAKLALIKYMPLLTRISSQRSLFCIDIKPPPHTEASTSQIFVAPQIFERRSNICVI